jgi:ABC-type phosphate/phosphonate transport system substrate-binding protein
MIAALPMYQFPELAESTTRWWAAIRTHLRHAGVSDVPEILADAHDRYAHWTHPDLLLSQTCGYPLLFSLGHQVSLVATPVYTVPGCDGMNYSSVILVREGSSAAKVEDLRGTRVAFNGTDSQSGYNCLRAMVAPLAIDGRFFGQALESGRHLTSATMVSDGRADVCAIDCVTWALAVATNNAPPGLRIALMSPSAPSLPYVTAAGRSAQEKHAIADALRAVSSDPALADVREQLMIRGFEFPSRAAYSPIAQMHDSARSEGYPRLA